MLYSKKEQKQFISIFAMVCFVPVNGLTNEELSPVNIISQTPLHGVGIERDKVPSNVGTANDKDISEQQSLDLTEFMNQRFGSVFINSAQNNPLQPDVQYRGFVASPLLGQPQGMSVYMDGVRINEPFGDNVSWALIPESAIADMNLMAGSNPLFGLNTLGGALSVKTKNGLTHPGTQGEIQAGSFGRKSAQIETGGEKDKLNYFLTGSWFDEDGWRDFSPSETKQLFGNLGWTTADSTIDLSLSIADTYLIGNGAVPEALLEERRESIFTRPDLTENKLGQLRLGGTHNIGESIVIEGLAYFRQSDVQSLNGDDSDFEACEDAENAGFVCESESDEEELALDQNGSPIAATDEVEGATINRSNTEQETLGFSLQSAFLNDLSGKENQFILGVAVDRSEVNFNSSTELGSLDETRQAISSGVLVEEAFTEVDTESQNLSFYFTDTWSASENMALTLSGRYNKTDIELKDRLGTELNGDHDFSRFNPAAGITYSLSPSLNTYVGYSESNRAPTAMELTCADPDDPCRLPNSFVADPPLEQVVAQTVEAGLRGNAKNFQWSAGLFQTVNKDDIIFISAGEATNQGFFDNIGETQRRGLELELKGHTINNRLNWFANFTHLQASFEENLKLSSPNSPFAVNGEVAVSPGDRLPGLPENSFKAGATYSLTPKLSIGGNLQYTSDIVLRGDEGNQDNPVDGYTLVNLHGEYTATKQLKFFAKINNTFNKEYENFGVYGEADEVLGNEDNDQDNETAEGSRFLSPGAPFGAWVGLKYDF